ncbi:hypothetical protein [Chryseobacterium sp. MDT2-18]|uniref:hypothetical protein n=1 Tax=Chryseobacterium sp. MDT2-18 TaxID=1259136 RepID=UPI002785DE6D|nr:hypothetical protein [Chryseobacterium sp. MDT2-18]MDQ0475587.1 hypothetical protein [Chryseobacterium sp. MDT2-18]
MQQNIFSILGILISFFSYAQKMPYKTIPNQKADSLNILKFKNNSTSDSLSFLSKNKRSLPVIKMPNAKPKDSSTYSALKGKARNDQPYKILNAVSENEKAVKK